MTTTNSPRVEPDVVDLLITDHREAIELIDRIHQAEPAQQRELADVLIAEIVRHSISEETVVYPAIRKNLPDGDEMVDHDTEEHNELELSLRALEGLDADDADFLPCVDKVEEQLRHHASDEEDHQFPQLREYCDAEELRSMAGQVEAVKKVAPTRPHPSSPDSPLFHLAVGPGIGLVDRLRDSLSGRATTPQDISTDASAR